MWAATGRATGYQRWHKGVGGWCWPLQAVSWLSRYCQPLVSRYNAKKCSSLILSLKTMSWITKIQCFLDCGDAPDQLSGGASGTTPAILVLFILSDRCNNN